MKDCFRTTVSPTNRVPSERYSDTMSVLIRGCASLLLASALLFAAAGAPGYAQQGAKAKSKADATAKSQADTPADPVVRRLILKDGSYQVVSQYEVVHAQGGDRVRYISAERGGDWEELPMSLIDWPATRQYAKQHANDAPFASKDTSDQDAAAIDKEEKADRNRDLEVAKDLRLPDETGVWALDTFHDGQELVELDQNSSTTGDQSGHNLLRSGLNGIGLTKQVIELNERHAKPALHEPQPVFYVSIDEDTDEPGADALTVDTHGASSGKHIASGSAATSQYVIVRAQVKKDFRLVAPVKVSSAGVPTASEDVTLTSLQLLDGKRWMKLTPKEPLLSGDYVLMELLSPKEVNLAVWDFRIDPGAGDNANAILPLQRYQIVH